MLKLGTIVTDVPTKIKGMLLIYQHDISGNSHYMFQPAGLNPETKQPLDTFWVSAGRIKGGEIDKESELPTDILNTIVEDKATGFKGTATALLYYLNGCIHFEVKPSGTIKKTGECITAKEFDLRRLKGPAIKELSAKELTESKKTKPSPEFGRPFNVTSGH